MPLILNIDTAVQTASICLSNDEEILGLTSSTTQQESASWLHTTIQEILRENNYHIRQLDAIAISAGPGSYTGLRVGMSAAKGLCYALSKPLIIIDTLQMMAASITYPTTDLLCPMIDARRMEVFTALYNNTLDEVLPSTPMILDDTSFSDWLKKYSITFLGNGSEKASTVIRHENALFSKVTAKADSMVRLSSKKFYASDFADIAYTEPNYGKDFHSSLSKKNY